MFHIPASDGGGVLLVHVVLKSSFKVSMSVAPRTGGSLSFS